MNLFYFKYTRNFVGRSKFKKIYEVKKIISIKTIQDIKEDNKY